MKDTDLMWIFAKSVNTLDIDLLEPFLAEDVTLHSQMVLVPLEGKTDVINHLRGKFETIRKSGVPTLCEMAYCGDGKTRNVMFWYARPGTPCCVIAQGGIDDLQALVLFDIEEAMLKTISTCIFPHPSTARRTGEYPGLGN